MITNIDSNDHTNCVRPILYYDEINPHSRAVLMLLNMLEVNVELRPIDMMKGEHLKAEYAKINPVCSVPFMLHKDITITGNAIFTYVCENIDTEKAKQLLALKCYKRHCIIVSRLFYESQILHRIHGQLMTDLVRKTIYETDVEYHRKKVEQAYDVIESFLKDSQFIAGSVLTAADISFVACLGALNMMFPIAEEPHRWVKLMDWFKRMSLLEVQEINTNGIEKQRRLVEYYGKCTLKSDINSFTTGISGSLKPRMTLRHELCSVAMQTTPQVDNRSQLEKPISNPISQENSEDVVALEPQRNLTEARQDTSEISANVDKIIESASLYEKSGQASTTVSESSKDEEINELISENASFAKTTGTETTEPARPTEIPSPTINAGGAQKGKPPVPPKRKRETPVLITENTQSLDLTKMEPQTTEQPVIFDKVRKILDDNELYSPPSTENQNLLSNSFTNLKSNQIPTENQTESLSRLDGGVVSVDYSKNQFENRTLKQSNITCPQLSKIYASASNKAGIDNSCITPKINEVVIAQKPFQNDSEARQIFGNKNLCVEETLISINFPLNCPQAALQYCRGANAPPIALGAPPPSPEIASQDELNDVVFPPPPSEVLLQSLTGTIFNGSKIVSSKAATGATAKRTSAVKSIKQNFKAPAQSAERVIIKKKCNMESGKKTAASDLKVVNKLSNRLLSGTKSPFSNISQSSLMKKQIRRVRKTLNGSSAQNHHKQTQQPNKISPITPVDSFISTTNITPKVIGRSSISNCTMGKSKEKIPEHRKNSQPLLLSSAINDKSTEVPQGNKAERTQQSLVTSARTEMSILSSPQNPLSTPLKTQTNIYAKPATTVVSSELTKKMGQKAKPMQIGKGSNHVREVVDQKPRAIRVAPELLARLITVKPKPLLALDSASKSGNANPEKSPKATIKEIKLSTQKLGSKAYPYKLQATNQIGQNKKTEVLDTSKPEARYLRNQSTLREVKRTLLKRSGKKGNKTTSQEKLRKAQPVIVKSRIFLEPKVEGADDHAPKDSEVSMVSEQILKQTSRQSQQRESTDHEIFYETNTFLKEEKFEEQSDCVILASPAVAEGLVSKTINMLNEVTKQVKRNSAPQPPPLPPQPLAFLLESQRVSTTKFAIPPTPLLPPAIAPIEDVLPKVGIVAKVLESLSYAKSEAHQLKGTTRSSEGVATYKENNLTSNEKVSRVVKTSKDAKPLADLIRESIWKLKRNKIDETSKTEISKATQKSLVKPENFEQKEEKKVQGTLYNTPTDSQHKNSLNVLKNSPNRDVVDLKVTEPQSLNIANSYVSSFAGEDNNRSDESLQTLAAESISTTVASLNADSIKELNLSTADTSTPAISCLLLGAFDGTNNLSESEVKPKKPTKTILATQKLNREPTTLLGKPCNPPPASFRYLTRRNGSCTHGLSASVVISKEARPPTQQHHIVSVVQPVRALSPRSHDQRPYPTAHRSRSRRSNEQNLIHRGRVV